MLTSDWFSNRSSSGSILRFDLTALQQATVDATADGLVCLCCCYGDQNFTLPPPADNQSTVEVLAAGRGSVCGDDWAARMMTALHSAQFPVSAKALNDMVTTTAAAAAEERPSGEWLRLCGSRAIVLEAAAGTSTPEYDPSDSNDPIYTSTGRI